MAVVNPFADLIQGVLQGHMLNEHMKNQAMQEQAFQRQMQREDEEGQIKDIQNQMMLRSAGRPVVGNVVQDMAPGVTGRISRQMVGGDMPDTTEATAPDPRIPDALRPNGPDSSTPTTQDLANLPTMKTSVDPALSRSGAVPYMRPVDKSRLLKYKGRDGSEVQVEAFTPEEIQQRQQDAAERAEALKAKLAGMGDVYKKQADRDYYESELSRRGVTAPDMLVRAGVAQQGQKVLPEELGGMIDKAKTILSPTYKDVPQGGSLYEVPNPIAAAGAPGQQARQGFIDSANAAAGNGPRLVASSPGKQTPEEDYADASAKALGLKSRTEMNKGQWDKVLGEYKASNQDPDMHGMMMATKESALASANLSRALRQTQLDQAPTKEQASDIADDLINHRLAPDQISQIRGRGNGGLGLMVYSAAKAKDPEFSWEKASSEYNLAKAPTFQQNVRYMDSVSESIPMVIDRAKKLDNVGVKSLAKAINWTKDQTNNIDLKKFRTDATLVSDEIAKILQGGGTGSGTSDAKMKQAGEILNTSDSPAAIAAALGDVQQLIGFRRKAMTKGTYLENAAPAEKPAAAAAGANPYR